VSESTVACDCSIDTRRSWVSPERTSITAMTASTAPKKLRSLTALPTGSRWNSTTASPATAAAVTSATAERRRFTPAHSTGKARNAWAPAEGSLVIQFIPQHSTTPMITTSR
jgi:hypothetical protein